MQPKVGITNNGEAPMRKDEVMEFFDGSPSELSKAIGLTVSAINQWGPYVPVSRRESIRLAMRERANDLDRKARALRKASKED
jgi:hypothetical protein